MKGSRPITREQVKNLIKVTTSIRDRALIAVGFSTGFRISELLSLQLKDVITDKTIHSHVSVRASKTKNKVGRTTKLNSDAIKAVKALVEWLKSKGLTDKSTPLFLSRKHANGENKAINRFQAHTILKSLFAKIGEMGNVATHTLRKTFAARIYETTKELIKVQAALGHKSINSTISYLSFNTNDIDNVIENFKFF
jgi:site-specific recombinase XerD